MYNILLFITLMLWSGLASADIPTNAHKYLDVLTQEATRLNSPIPVHVLAGLIETETCVSLKSKTCWSPYAQYKTSRERGVGFGMITKAYKRNGKIRFDSMVAVRKSHKSLRRLTWSNVKSKPRLQIRALVIRVKDIWDALPAGTEYNAKIAMTLSAYNQGGGGLRKDIRMCKKDKKCDSTKWLGNVRDIKRKGFSTRRIGGTARTAWQINRKHVVKTLSRSKKYLNVKPKVTDNRMLLLVAMLLK